MSRYISSRFDTLKEYIPGEQPKDMKYVKLNTNESPYPPSPKAIEAIEEQAKLINLYPDPEATDLVAAIADNYGIDAENVITVNGSDEALSFCFMAFCDEKKGMAYADITYGFYSVYAELYGIKSQVIPLRDNLSLRADDYMDTECNIVIANPNAPTGMCIPVSDIERLLVKDPDRLVIVDEAYVDFGGESALPLIKKHKNLIVIRTFSKSRSAAGGRLGYAMADKELIADLKKIKYSTNPYNVNRMTAAAGAAAMRDTEYFDRCINAVKATREYTVSELEKLGFEVLPSSANFIFVRHGKLSGGEYYAELRKKGVLTRHFTQKRIENYLRISIGDDEQMKILLEKTKEILYNKGVI